MADQPYVQIYFNGTGHRADNFMRVGHVSEDPTVIGHCPFCGSGSITGRSDGGADCELCGKAFTVLEQPLYSNMPSSDQPANVEVTPFDPLTKETPFDDGSAGPGPPGQDPAAPPSGESAGDEPPESAEEETPAFFQATLRTPEGVLLTDDDYVLRHAIRAARAHGV